MKGNKELAVKKFKQGYNCCQAVACAYCEELGIKEEDVFRLTEGRPCQGRTLRSSG